MRDNSKKLRADVQRSRWRLLPAVLVVILGLSATSALAYLVREVDRARAQLSVKQIGAERVHAFEQALTSALESVHAIAAFQESSQVVDREEFRVFASRFLSWHPELQALEWIPRVALHERDSYERDARQDGHEGFVFTELRDSGGQSPAAEREEYFPVFFVEPLAGNERALGFDLGSNPARRAALEHARDTGEITATARITLVQERGSSYGVLVFQPVYRKDARLTTLAEPRDGLRGFALGVVRLEEMVVSTMLRGPGFAEMNVTVHDNSAPPEERVLFSRETESPASLPVNASIRFAGRDWLVRCNPMPHVLQAANWARFWIVALSGCAVSILLGGYLAVLVLRKAKVERLVEQRTVELRVANLGLEKNAETLTQLNKQLVHKNKDLDDFGFMASHDLQEPLRKMISFSDLLRKDAGDNLPEDARKDLGFIEDAAQRMNKLVQDLLALSRVGTTEMPKEPVCLDDCVDEALESLSLSLNESNAEIIRTPLGEVRGDPVLLTQMFQNLLENAIKYREPGTTPVVQITRETQDGLNVFGVKDNGIGIEHDYLEKIFDPFRRLHGRDEFAGSGIGLAICEKAIRSHGGRIWVESEPGKGSVFKFTIPMGCRDLVASSPERIP